MTTPLISRKTCFSNSARLLLAAAMLLVACNEAALERKSAPNGSASALPRGLTPELSRKVLAKVGEREITLGEYAATLDRMDQFERLRYQTADRRRKLLDEIINMELLAREAKQRGLDKQPQTEERVRQVLRDEILKQTRTNLPTPASIPEREVREYYDKHRDEFREPERRRVAHIVVADAAKAKKVLELAQKATPAQWGKLVSEQSLDKPPKASVTAPLELFGDLGIVSAPGEERGDNPQVSTKVRAAAFKIDKVGGVHPEVVEDNGRFEIVRLTGKTDARDRSFAEAERTIRVAILQQRMTSAEQKLERDLRQRFGVKVDEAALGLVRVRAAEKAGSGGTGPAQK